jgi:4-hydroxy-tetrahydrodipicolinate synthase
VVAEVHLRGVYVPVVTPFDRHGRVDLAALERLIDQVLTAGAAGVVALATTGEPTSLDDAERDAVLRTCSRVCTDRGAGLIVGAGTNDTRTTLARHEDLANVPGVIASLAVVPYYVRPTEAAIVAHFQHVAARSPVPMLTYNVPYRTGRGLSATSLLELAATDNVAGVKQAVDGIDADTLTVLAEAPQGFTLLGGDDPYLFPLTLMGAPGAIAASANLCTRRFVTMIDHGMAARSRRAGRTPRRCFRWSGHCSPNLVRPSSRRCCTPTGSFRPPMCGCLCRTLLRTRYSRRWRCGRCN